MTVENAHKAGIRVAICGDLAGDASLTEAFAGMGVDELSVPAILIPNLL
jgi:phosphotransferase system enzyme I (PtsI)